MPYIDLSRRFRDLTEKELEAPELLASLNEQSLRWADGWTELLQHPRVVLLAEAGSGKTVEMREQADRLRAEGKPAFLVALESLDREPLAALLSPREEQAFEAWKADDQSTAWFFLDAVDELKLTQGKLERALARLAKAIDGVLHRSYVVISCRPYDWRPSVDMATLKAKLPIKPIQQIPVSESDEVFLAALREREGTRQAGQKKASVVGPRVVILLPLSERQIMSLANGLGVVDTSAFIAEIRRQHAWTFARRPLDLMELVTSWKASGRLGTRVEQHAANVASKLRDPDRPDRGLLSDERARIGAERLALALALTRKRTIRLPEQALDVERAEGVLHPTEVLTDWTEEERQTLLRRALFDPATYGRIRFHHSSVQEYLAARRLHALRELGMSRRNLRRLLFAERYGFQLVIPSMQAITAWLALWDDDIRRELMAREPETLLSMGDPESLPIPVRIQLLRSFATAYGEGGWRGLNIPINEVRRLAHPELTGVVRELWDARPTSPDLTELLLEIIWQGPIEGCADIAREAAFDTTQADYHRVAAVRALAACGKIEILSEFKNSILNEPSSWPDRVVNRVVEELFPTVLSVADLIDLIERMPEPKNTVGGFSWAMRQIVETIEPLSDLARELRDALADLVWRGREERQQWYRLKGRFDHVAPALARLCDRQLEAKPQASVSDPALIWACVVASRFGDDEKGLDELVKNLKRNFQSNSALREDAFWNELKLTSEAAPAEHAKERCFHAEERSLVGWLTADDRPWLLEALRNSRDKDLRLVALHALVRLWNSSGREETELGELSTAVQDDVALTAVLRQENTPPEPNREYEKWQRRERREKLVRSRRERHRLDKWLSWKKELLANPAAAFTAEELSTTIRNLYHWLEAKHGSHYNVWDMDALREAFGDDITARAAKAFQATWRVHPPPTLWSQRTAEDRNRELQVWLEGLTGLAAEALNTGWATHLTQEEAKVAAAYATIELNEFSSWLPDLVAAHPAVVDEVIGGELTAELAVTREHPHLPTLQKLSYADISIERLVVPRLLAVLPDWPSTFPDVKSSQGSAHHLSQVLGILQDTIEGQQRVTVAAICEQRFPGDQSGPLALIWLQGLFRLDPERATRVLEGSLASLPEEDRSGCAVETFAHLFGDRNTFLAFANEMERASALGRLVRCAFRYVRPAEDQEHEGVYSPDMRDRAERARNFLLTTLLDTPGAEAQKVLSDLAEDPLFAYFPDRLRLLARQRAAADAESAPLRPEEVVALEKRFEAPPHDRDGLFTVMIDRLDDLAHDIAHDDFTDRRTLRTIKDESEMQRTLARRLRDAAKGAYAITREDEVADLKKTDIRLAATRGDQKAVIEVKICDERWSLTELGQALRAQLVGQYLRHDTCRAGCLLLTYDGTKKYWKHPETGKRLDFAKMIEYLRCSAQAIEQGLEYRVRLAVYPLDLTDPPLEPAHRRRLTAHRRRETVPH